MGLTLQTYSPAAEQQWAAQLGGVTSSSSAAPSPTPTPVKTTPVTPAIVNVASQVASTPSHSVVTGTLNSGASSQRGLASLSIGAAALLAALAL